MEDEVEEGGKRYIRMKIIIRTARKIVVKIVVYNVTQN